jgi:hypothetical protein
MGSNEPPPIEVVEYEICHYVWPGATPQQVRDEDETTVLKHRIVWIQERRAMAAQNPAAKRGRGK